MMRVPAIACCLLVALMPLTGSAQTLYKSVMPDGRVVYSDKPPPGAVKVEEKKADTGKRGVTAPSAREKAALNKMTQERLAREAAQDRVRRAEIALHDAEVAQQMGKEPRPNERQGTATGAQRLTDGYWARQKQLEDNVDKARKDLEQIRASSK